MYSFEKITSRLAKQLLMEDHYLNIRVSNARQLPTKEPMQLLITLLVFACLSIAFQSNELSETAKEGIKRVDEGFNADAVRYLEEAARADPKSAAIQQYLGRAYLGSSDRLDMKVRLEKAEKAFENAISLGGSAVFAVDLSLEKGGVPILGPTKNVLNVCRGRINIDKNKVTFAPDTNEKTCSADTHGLTLTGAEIKAFGMSKRGENTNVWELEPQKGKKRHFRTANFSEEEAKMIFRLLEKHLGVKGRR